MASPDAPNLTGEPTASPETGNTTEDDETAPPSVLVDASGRRTLILTVTDGYHPRAFPARAGVPTTLILRGEDSGGCPVRGGRTYRPR